MRSLRLTLLACLLALCAGPLAAYVVWLKDGTSINARGKYEVKNGRAIITLVNGEQSFIDAAQIDVARTEAANRGKDYGATDLGTTRVVPGEEPVAPTAKSLGDLVTTHRPSARQLPTARRANERAPGQAARSLAGYLDLAALQNVPYPRTEVSADLLQFFRSQGVEEVEIWSGSQADRLLIEITTASEGSVFQGLTAAANALLRVRDHFPPPMPPTPPASQINAFELVMKTPAREKAGQFVMTPEAAAALAAKRIEPPAFFVANVQF